MPNKEMARALIEPVLTGSQTVHIGPHEWGVPEDARVVPVRDGARAVYVLNERGTHVHVLLEHRGRVLELKLPHAIQMVVLAQRFAGAES